MKGKIRMTLVVDADLHDGEYLIPDDFVPPFLSAPTPAVVPTPELEAPPVELLQPEEASSSPNVPPPLEEIPLCAAPVYTKKKRTLIGFIRATWFYVFTIVGEILNYVLENITGIGLPQGVAGTLIAGALYGAKRGIWPDTTL